MELLLLVSAEVLFNFLNQITSRKMDALPLHGGVSNKGTKAARKVIRDHAPVRNLYFNYGKTVNFERKTNVEAGLAFRRGKIAEPPCVNCSKGNGPFPQCIVLKTFFNGACASCHYNSEDRRCSFLNRYLIVIRFNLGFFTMIEWLISSAVSCSSMCRLNA